MEWVFSLLGWGLAGGAGVAGGRRLGARTLGRAVLSARPFDTWEFDKLEVRRHVPGRRIGFQPVREATWTIERPMTRIPGIISLRRRAGAQ